MRLARLAECIDRGLAEVTEDQKEIREQVEDVRRVDAVFQPEAGSRDERRAKFDAILQEFIRDENPVRTHMAGVMERFAAGLFTGGDEPDLPDDNLDLERWFRNPKGHERRIHGRAHAGVRIVEEGPTLAPALDAHVIHPAPFTAEELIPYAQAALPASEREAIHRRKIMRKARSKKKRPQLLADLEARYSDTS